jgi:hypothetical protein
MVNPVITAVLSSPFSILTTDPDEPPSMIVVDIYEVSPVVKKRDARTILCVWKLTFS